MNCINFKFKPFLKPKNKIEYIKTIILIGNYIKCLCFSTLPIMKIFKNIFGR